MKILYCTNRNPNFPTITEYVEDALKALGTDVTFFDDRAFMIPGRLRQRLPFLQTFDLNRLNRSLLRAVQREKPDVCLVAGGHRIQGETVQKIRETGCTAALWTIDPPREFELLQNAAPHYDHIVCGGTEAIELFKTGNVTGNWLPFACDESQHHPVDVTEDDRAAYGVDAAFVGSYYANRCELFEALAGMSFKAWGPAWEKVPVGHPLKDQVVPRQILPGTWLRIFSAAKSVIVTHYQDGQVPCYQASPKVYEALACGAFVLVDDQPDVFNLYEDGVHLVKYRNGQELVEKVQYYAEHDEERCTIATAGREETLAKHTYRHRMQTLLDQVGKIMPK